MQPCWNWKGSSWNCCHKGPWRSLNLIINQRGGKEGLILSIFVFTKPEKPIFYLCFKCFQFVTIQWRGIRSQLKGGRATFSVCVSQICYLPHRFLVSKRMIQGWCNNSSAPAEVQGHYAALFHVKLCTWYQYLINGSLLELVSSKQMLGYEWNIQNCACKLAPQVSPSLFFLPGNLHFMYRLEISTWQLKYEKVRFVSCCFLISPWLRWTLTQTAFDEKMAHL